MKKAIALSLVLLLILSISSAFAADVGVLIIQGDQEDDVSDLLNDMQLTVPVSLPGYATVKITSCEFVGEINRRNSYATSGIEAEFVYLRLDILNNTRKPIDFSKQLSTQVIYRDDYIFEGIISFYDYDYSQNQAYFDGDSAEIGILYEGHYGIRCLLPNAIVNDKIGPLKMVIKLGGHEMAYNIRK